MTKAAKPRVKAGTSKDAAAVRRKAFVQAFIANGRNETAAAITAGFSGKTASAAASRLLRDVRVREMVDEITAEHEAATGLTTENVLREVRRVAFSDPRKLLRADGTLKPPSEWDDDTAAFVGGLEIAEEFEGRGDARVSTGFTKKLKIWDKNAALEKAMKHLGLFEKDNSQVNKPVSINMVFE